MSETLSKKQNTRRLAESGVMIALSVVLSVLPVINLPYGGSVTVFSQVPIVVLSYRYGPKWGIKAGLVMGVIEMLFGLKNFSYVTGIGAYFILVLADYLVAFGVLGLGGMFRKVIRNQAISLALGAVTVSAMRYFCHFISGVTIWRSYAADAHLPVWRYSLGYNGSYMLPEAIITAVGVVILSVIFDLSAPELKVRLKKKPAADFADENNAELTK